MVAFYPTLLHSHQPEYGPRRVVNQSVDTYYSWPNMKKRMAIDYAMNSSGQDSNAAVNALMAYSLMTTAEKVGKFYNRRLQAAEKRFPALAEFRNAHPIIGNAVVWTPGVILAGGSAAGLAYGFKLLKKTNWMKMLNSNPALQKIGLASVIVVGLATSFIGILARKGTQSAVQSSRDYRALRKENPDLAPGELSQMNRALRNQAFLQQDQAAAALRNQRAFNPYFNTANPLQVTTSDPEQLESQAVPKSNSLFESITPSSIYIN